MTSFVARSSLKRTDRYSSPYLMLALLFICTLAPYGTFSFAGGILRIDHFAVPLVFSYVLVRRRLQIWPPLLVALFSFVGLSLLSTIASLDIFFGTPLIGLKYLDGMLRGPFVFAIATTVRPSARGTQLILRGISAFAIACALFSIIDRTVPLETAVMQRLIDLYGGPVNEGNVLNVNHKHLMLISSRATAFFVTPPSLAMVSLFFIAAGMARGAPISTLERVALIASGFVGGVLSNSKSFFFGIFALSALTILQKQPVVLRVAQALFLVVSMVALIVFWQGDESLASNPLERITESNDLVAGATGGRFGGSEWNANMVVEAVLDDSPLLGFGLGERSDIIYSDSGLNRLLLHAGILGLVLVSLGVGAQVLWFLRHRRSNWSRLGLQVLLVALSLFLAAPIFMMVRVNDILFTILGVAVAYCKSADNPPQEAPSPRAPIAPTRNGQPASLVQVARESIE